MILARFFFCCGVSFFSMFLMWMSCSSLISFQFIFFSSCFLVFVFFLFAGISSRVFFVLLFFVFCIWGIFVVLGISFCFFSVLRVTRVLMSCFPVLDFFGWNACPYFVVRHVFGDYAVRSYYGVVADADSGLDECSVAYVAVVSYRYFLVEFLAVCVSSCASDVCVGAYSRVFSYSRVPQEWGV